MAKNNKERLKTIAQVLSDEQRQQLLSKANEINNRKSKKACFIAILREIRYFQHQYSHRIIQNDSFLVFLLLVLVIFAIISLSSIQPSHAFIGGPIITFLLVIMAWALIKTQGKWHLLNGTIVIGYIYIIGPIFVLLLISIIFRQPICEQLLYALQSAANITVFLHLIGSWWKIKH